MSSDTHQATRSGPTRIALEYRKPRQWQEVVWWPGIDAKIAEM